MTTAEEKALSQELARACIQRAMDHIERAQTELGRACEDLSPIVGGSSTWMRGSKLYDSVHSFWYTVRNLGERLAKRGGPLVDELHVSNEMERRAKGSTPGAEAQP